MLVPMCVCVCVCYGKSGTAYAKFGTDLDGITCSQDPSSDPKVTALNSRYKRAPQLPTRELRYGLRVVCGTDILYIATRLYS